MIRRQLPVLATWLLKRIAAGRYSESMAGDLIEQYGQGRSRLWYWRQVLGVAFARVRAIRTRPWIAAKRTILHIAIEMPVVLGIVASIDQSRRTDTLGEMLSATFLATMALLLAIALMGLALLRQTRRSIHQHALMNHLIVLFALASLGASTLTWAQTTRLSACGTRTCTCQKVESPFDEARQ